MNVIKGLRLAQVVDLEECKLRVDSCVIQFLLAKGRALKEHVKSNSRVNQDNDIEL